MHKKPQQRVVAAISLFMIAILLSGCSLLFGGRSSEGDPTPEVEDRAVVPTFTPTPELPPTEIPAPTAEAPAVVEIAPTEAEVAAPAEESAPEEAAAPAEEPTEPAPSPTPVPKVVVSAAAANVRTGPGTEYGLAGAVNQGQAFDVVGKNADGTWWQFCCVNGQQAWVFGELVSVENADGVTVAQDIPPTPVPVAAAPVQQAPAPTVAPAAPVEEAPAPTDVPEAAPPPPAGAVNAGGCGGDDGCKFRVTGGPTLAPNSGGELKFQLFFMHSGVDGGQPQGDYRLGIEKDGQLISTFADTTSRALDKNQGSMGPYNYEAKIAASDLPGGSLEGNYSFWVLDGNRERDSDVYQLFIPAGQGEVWIQFDQG